MSTTDNGSPASEPAPSSEERPTAKPSPTHNHVVGLAWMLGMGWGLAIVLGIWGASIDTSSSFFGPSSSDIALKAGLAAWADISLLVAVVSTVGLIVLRGVQALLNAGTREGATRAHTAPQ